MTPREPPRPGNDRVLYVIADTHLGLSEIAPEVHRDRPTDVADFLRWLHAVPAQGERLPVWDGRDVATRVLRPADELVLLGDIVELWDAENQAVLLSTFTVAAALAPLAARKVYVIGNHDNILHSIAGSYPLGVPGLDVVGEMYPATDEGAPDPLRIGDQHYLFVHGHQFDLAFVSSRGLWRILGPLRQVGAALGDYAWVFAAWWVAAVAVELAYGFTPEGWLLVAGLPVLWFPRFYMRGARRLWRRLIGNRYNRDATLEGFQGWWRGVQAHPNIPDRVNIVYGHTHFLDWLRPGAEPPPGCTMTAGEAKLEEVIGQTGAKRPTLYNTSSWVSAGGKRADVAMATVLYADAEGPLFVGWDWRAKRPFHIPFEFVAKRRGNQRLDGAEVKVAEGLGWPRGMIEKWESTTEDI